MARLDLLSGLRGAPGRCGLVPGAADREASSDYSPNHRETPEVWPRRPSHSRESVGCLLGPVLSGLSARAHLVAFLPCASGWTPAEPCSPGSLPSPVRHESRFALALCLSQVSRNTRACAEAIERPRLTPRLNFRPPSSTLRPCLAVRALRAVIGRWRPRMLLAGRKRASWRRLGSRSRLIAGAGRRLLRRSRLTHGV